MGKLLIDFPDALLDLSARTEEYWTRRAFAILASIVAALFVFLGAIATGSSDPLGTIQEMRHLFGPLIAAVSILAASVLFSAIHEQKIERFNRESRHLKHKLRTAKAAIETPAAELHEAYQMPHDDLGYKKIEKRPEIVAEANEAITEINDGMMKRTKKADRLLMIGSLIWIGMAGVCVCIALVVFKIFFDLPA